VLCQVVEKEFPLRDAPKLGHLVIVKANHESGNEIEFLSEVAEGTKRLNLLNDTADIEQARDFTEHGQPIHVEPNSGMAEELRDVKKVSGAAAEVENPPGTHQIKFEVANPADVNSDPAVEIEILGPIRAGVCHCVSSANLLERGWIDRLDNTLCLEREPVRAQHPKGVFSSAREAAAVYQFLNLMTKSHNSHLVAKQDNFN